MVSLDVFLSGLMLVSTLTGVTTEGVKKMLAGRKIDYNVLTGIVALVLSCGVGIGYVILSKLTFTAEIIVYIVGLVFMSWLCAMIGYDKIREAIKTFKGAR